MAGLESVQERPYRRGEVAGYRLAVAATGDPAVNRAVFEDGESAGVWVNSADDPASCSFILPAIARQGPVSVAVSTSGFSPALASWLKAARGRAPRPRGGRTGGDAGGSTRPGEGLRAQHRGG